MGRPHNGGVVLALGQARFLDDLHLCASARDLSASGNRHSFALAPRSFLATSFVQPKAAATAEVYSVWPPHGQLRT